MVAQANAVAAVATAVLNDPALREALSGIGRAVSSITMPAQRASTSMASVASASADMGRAADSASRSVSDLAGNWKTLLGEVKSVFDVVHQAVIELRGGVDANVMMRAEQGRAFIGDALAAMRATGALPEADKLREAIEAAKGGIRAQDFASTRDYELQRLLLAGQLGEMEGVAGKQMSFAEQQVKLLEEQNATADAQLEVLRAQLRLAGGSVSAPAPSTPTPLPWIAPPRWDSPPQGGDGAITNQAADQRELLKRLDELIAAVQAGADSSDEVHRLLQRVTRNGQAMQTEGTP